MPKLYAIDSMAVLYRGYFALIRNPLINSKGLNTSGVRIFLMQLIKIIEEEKPDYIAVTSDSSQPTFRHKRYSAYKATREKMPEDLVAQLPYMPRLVEALNLPYMILPGYEADDIVGTLMRMCREAEIEGVMVTSDKDYMQLVSETTSMLNHKNEHIGIAQVQEKFGGTPEQVIEVLGLMGDASDNIPGVRGVGEKTAIKLIKEYGDIETVYQNLDKITGKSLKVKLEEDRENAFLSKELVTIDCHVPLEFTLQDVHLGNTDLYNNPEFHELLEELEFNSLLNKLLKKKNSAPLNTNNSANSANSETQKTNTSQNQHQDNETESHEKEQQILEVTSNLLNSLTELKQFLDTVPQGNNLAVSLQISGDHQKDLKLEGMAFCFQAAEAFYFKMDHAVKNTSEFQQAFRKLMETVHNPIILHQSKQAVQALNNEHLTWTNFSSDVLLAAHLCDPLAKRLDLDYLMDRMLNLSRKPMDFNNQDSETQLSMFQEKHDHDYIYFCENASAILQLHQQLDAQLEQSQMQYTYQNIELPLASVLARLEQTGVKIDSLGLGDIASEFDERLDVLRKTAFDLAGEEFNPNSIVELQNIIYEKKRLHEKFKVKPRKIKLGNKMSTDEETLEKMSEDPLPQTILHYRTLNKLKNTYVDQLPTFVHSESGCIHSNFKQTGTATGRLSSDNPNLQNIPIRSLEGRRIRGAFIPSSKERILVSADYSQIELRVVAHYSKDPTFMDAYRRNHDIHALTASAIFSVPEEDVTRAMRSRAKEVNFGLIYRMGPERLSIVTKTSKSEAKEFIERFFQKYSTIHSLQERFLEEARKEGFTETLFGRRRYLPEIHGKGLMKRMAEGAAVNTPIQGSAAEIIKLAMIAVDRKLSENKMQSKMILSIHDELVFDTLKEEEEDLCVLVKDTMENVVGLEVPLLVEVGKGENWLDAH